MYALWSLILYYWNLRSVGQIVFNGEVRARTRDPEERGRMVFRKRFPGNSIPRAIASPRSTAERSDEIWPQLAPAQTVTGG